MDTSTAIRIDSRFRTSGTTSDFRWQLPEAVALPENCKCYVQSFVVPHSWVNCQAGLSDQLFVIERRTSGQPQRKCRRIQLPEGQYTSSTLPTAIANALNTGTLFQGVMQYTVTYQSLRGTLRITLGVASGATVDNTATFRLPSEEEVTSATWKASEWTGTVDEYSVLDADSCGDLLRLPSVTGFTTDLETGLIDVSPTHVLFLHSQLSNNNNVGPRAEDSGCVACIPVTSNFGYTLIHTGSVDAAFPVDVKVINEISLRLTNSRGRVVDTRGSSIVCEFIFLKEK